MPIRICAAQKDNVTPLEIVQKENELLKAELEDETVAAEAEIQAETPEDFWSPAVEGKASLMDECEGFGV